MTWQAVFYRSFPLSLGQNLLCLPRKQLRTTIPTDRFYLHRNHIGFLPSDPADIALIGARETATAGRKAHPDWSADFHTDARMICGAEPHSAIRAITHKNPPQKINLPIPQPQERSLSRKATILYPAMEFSRILERFPGIRTGQPLHPPRSTTKTGKGNAECMNEDPGRLMRVTVANEGKR
jgi:hypothetical protein